MSKKYTQESFSESLDRRLSGFQADPWLAQRIIASGKGETKVKKKDIPPWDVSCSMKSCPRIWAMWTEALPAMNCFPRLISW